MEDGDYSIEQSSQIFIEDLSAFMNDIPLEQRENAQMQLEYEVNMMEEKGMIVVKLRELINDGSDQAI